MCNLRTTTVITFILRISTLQFPLARHISHWVKTAFIFSNSSCQNFAFPSPLTTPSLKITHRRASYLSLALLRPEGGGLRSVAWGSLCGARRAGRWGIQIPVCHCLAVLHFSLAWLSLAAGVWPPQSAPSVSRLSSAPRLGPLSVNLPARDEGQKQAVFLQLRWKNTLKLSSAQHTKRLQRTQPLDQLSPQKKPSFTPYLNIKWCWFLVGWIVSQQALFFFKFSFNVFSELLR